MTHLEWPRLRVDDWTPTRETVHMWTQIIGKVRMAHAPMLNHWWQVTLYVTPRGLTTSMIPYARGAYDIEFDFLEHRLHIRSSNGTSAFVVLGAKSVAEFHSEVFEALGRLGIEASIRGIPNEVEPAIPFAEDHQHASYDPEAIQFFWRQLVQADRVLNEFRSRFRGKTSPVHFFWGGMDLAYSRFSGRDAPTHPGGVPELRRLGDGGGLLSRAEQLWVLARGRGRRGLLCLLLSRVRRLRRICERRRRGRLQQRRQALRPPV